MTIRIFLIDSRPFLRSGIRAALASTPDMETIGEANFITQALSCLQAIRPDVVVIEWPPVDSGLGMTLDVDCPWLALGDMDSDSFLFLAMKAGAVGYVGKSMAPEALLDAVRMAAQRQSIWTWEQRQRMRSWKQEVYQKWESFGERQRQIIYWLAQGITEKAIARELSLSERTVESHVRDLLQKLDLTTRNEIVAWAMKAGLWPLIEQNQEKYGGQDQGFPG